MGNRSHVGTTLVQVSVAGRPFKCECNANVFRKASAHIYVCNACGAEYEGAERGNREESQR